MAIRVATAVAAAMNDAHVDAVDGGAGTVGTLELRTGPRPTNIGDPDAGTLLAELSLPNPAFGASVDGVATAGAIATVQGVADGDVGHARVKDTDGTPVWDQDDVGTAGNAITLNTVTISTGVNVTVNSWTVTQPTG